MNADPAFTRSEAERRTEIRCARISIDFFVVATVSLACGVVAGPWVVGKLSEYFYQMPVIALVHTFALGWITAAMMGVMYRYVPALTHGVLPYPRLLMPQLILYVIGVSGMISHFALGSWLGVWSASIVTIASIVMFAANIFPLLWTRITRGFAESGMFLALCFLIAAATLGFMLALDKSYGFMPGNVISNLAGHAHFAAIGWVTLTVCAISYRMLPAMILPGIALPKSAAWHLYGLAAGVIGLAVTLIARLPGATLWSVAISLALAGYVATIMRLVWARRKPIDWSVRHAIAGVTWLIVAIVLGIMLASSGAESESGARIAASYGVAGILGWIGNLIIGVSYHLFPGFVIRVRTLHGWRQMTHAGLSDTRLQPLTFTALNMGIATLIAGLLASSLLICELASILIATGCLSYSAVTMWTLSFAYGRKRI